MKETLHYLDENGAPESLTLPQLPVSRMDVLNGYVMVFNEDRSMSIMMVPLQRVLLIRTEPEA